MIDAAIHSTRSSHREALLEHLFAGEVMKHLWLRGAWRLELLKPQVDDGGYDLVLEANSIIRHSTQIVFPGLYGEYSEHQPFAWHEAERVRDLHAVRS